VNGVEGPLSSVAGSLSECIFIDRDHSHGGAAAPAAATFSAPIFAVSAGYPMSPSPSQRT